MKISVIIPTYKPKDYLWECLNSLVAQTISKTVFEVIVVLNGCCEPWKHDIQQYINDYMKDMNVNFIQIDQGGVSNARNIALDVAKGEYITFIDDDDLISPTYLEELYKYSSLDTVVLSNAYAFNDGFLDIQLPYKLSRIYSEFSTKEKCRITSKVRSYFSGPCMKLIPKHFVTGKRFDVRFKNGEDSLFMFLISDKIKQCKFADRKAVYYRRFRENSAVTTKRSKKHIIANQLRMIGEYTNMYFKHPLDYSFHFYLTRMLGAVKSIFFS